jgi:hypothetical protein
MRQRSRIGLVLLAGSAAAWIGFPGVALSQPAQPAQPAPQAAQPAPQAAQNAADHHELPASIQLEHANMLRRLGILMKRKGAVGVAARKAEAILKQHMAWEVEFILPPLTLLPYLAEGKVTPDMAWAMTMTDRTKASQQEIFEQRAEMTDALNGIVTAALPVHDDEAIAFAEDVAADVLGDTEIEEPTVLLIGEYLHSKLDAAH